MQYLSKSTMFQARILELFVLAPLVAIRSVPKGGSHHNSRQELLYK